ncbi:hypothetical protein BDV93DRAFT_76919 [Ceratobasidium sp. AG-I]|nr:hypothetical protein BDV93DRAFT_76919 [Ceratobasidium sp. AG-I]
MDRLRDNAPPGVALDQSLSDPGSPENFGLHSARPNARAQYRRGDNRKQTLLTLIDELAELRAEGNDQAKGEDVTYGSIIDQQSRTETEGVRRFQTFDERIRNLDLKLQYFVNGVRQLGSSGGLLYTVHCLKSSLAQVRHDFQINASGLFDGVLRQSGSSAKLSHLLKPDVSALPLERAGRVDMLPQHLISLAKELGRFLARINGVTGYLDEVFNAAIDEFVHDLMYRASCLKEFEGNLNRTATAKYINDLTEEFTPQIDNIAASLDNFTLVGVPTIVAAQKQVASRFQNLSTVATFFSGVTATTLQYSFETHGTFLPDFVNAMWISSLVLSIGSIINSQLAYYWRTAECCPPRNHVPWWIEVWVTRTPLILLVGSVFTFLAGLCAFTYSSSQSPVVRHIVLILTAIMSAALCVLFCAC